MGVGLQEVQAVSVPFATVSSVGLLEKSATAKLQPSFGEIARAILEEVDEIGLRAAKAPSVSAFKKEREEKLYPVYVRLNRAINELMAAKLDQSDLTSIVEVSGSVLRENVENEWASHFSADVHSEILFALSSMQNAQVLVRRVMATKPLDDPAIKAQNEELRQNYNLCAQWAGFHFEVLRAAFAHKITIAADVLEQVLEGFRLSVMAYSFVRQATELRGMFDARYSEELEATWDDEDVALANSE